jgi:hypothetical protein
MNAQTAGRTLKERCRCDSATHVEIDVIMVVLPALVVQLPDAGAVPELEASVEAASKRPLHQ